MSDKNFGSFIKNIEKRIIGEFPPIKDIDFKKGIIPDFPKYNPRTISSDYFGIPVEGVQINQDGKISIQGFRCKSCGALQWTGIWRKVNKERCSECEGLLEFETIDDFKKDWKRHWESKPLEEFFKESMLPCLRKVINGEDGRKNGL